MVVRSQGWKAAKAGQSRWLWTCQPFLHVTHTARTVTAVTVAPGPLDAPMRRVASVLHRRFGGAATLTFVSAVTFDPVTGAATATVSSDSVKAVVVEHTDDGTQNTMKVTVAARDLDDEPNEGDRVILGTDVYEVLNVKPYWSGSQHALYELTVRKP